MYDTFMSIKPVFMFLQRHSSIYAHHDHVTSNTEKPRNTQQAPRLKHRTYGLIEVGHYQELFLYHYIFHLNNRQKLILFHKNKPVFGPPPPFFIPHKNINVILCNFYPSGHNDNNFVMPVYHKLYTANHYYNHTTDIIPLLPVF